MRFRYLLLPLFLLPLSVEAYWTGIGAFSGQDDSDWKLDTVTRVADRSRYGLHVEERARSGFIIGASAGQFSLRLKDPLQVADSQKYNGQFLQFYLRWPLALSDSLTLHSRLDYQFNLGELLSGEQGDEINWNEMGLTLGVALRLGLVSLQPFINWSSLDGDITLQSRSEGFENDEKVSYGMMVDIYVEPTAYVRLKGTAVNTSSVWLGFIREY